MNSELLEQFNVVGANGLPYSIPIHPNLVHLTLGLFIIAILFDAVGVFLPVSKFIFKYFSVPVERENLFDVGWYNILAAAVITSFTVAAGFYEMMLAEVPLDIKSAWGMTAMETILWHGMGGVFLLILILAMAVWRGLQRFVWRKQEDRQVQWLYLFAGATIMFVMYVHGTLGAQMAAEFGIHNTADSLLRSGQDLNDMLK
ncbi:Na+-dependent transporters of the SNF family [Richelia intracellularis HH01]|jgi:uncharacterized membrane protein|uniref:Na+-dependent transporters of the SNF family n=1 Tax=Richelia intracellularis HH01 TaxID=1165094 RepID=M1X2Q3_9NOST|nr:DUF2231 domain-containing protein [Richelia intracellularis]CCH67225.1 Na+-dependent transporters of the SNF family [Richelia intracellularis HH01]HAE06624.1 DUF2231 domain-containing protein [Richelia sp.]